MDAFAETAHALGAMANSKAQSADELNGFCSLSKLAPARAAA
ncbi:hypothetical protein [Lentibacter sp.]